MAARDKREGESVTGWAGGHGDDEGAECGAEDCEEDGGGDDCCWC